MPTNSDQRRVQVKQETYQAAALQQDKYSVQAKASHSEFQKQYSN
jgi:hypothetical protein